MATTIIIYIFLRKEADRYFRGVRETKERTSRIISLHLIRNILSFYATGKTSKETEKAIESMIKNGEFSEKDLDQIVVKAIPEISELYRYINAIHKGDHEGAVIETLLKILVNLILLYGILFSEIVFSVLIASMVIPLQVPIHEISLLLLGSAAVFSVISVFLCIEIFRRVKLIYRLPMDFPMVNPIDG